MHDVQFPGSFPYSPKPHFEQVVDPSNSVVSPSLHWMHSVKFLSESPRFQPAGHALQVVLLNPNLPTPHLEHDAEPGSSVNVPNVQSVQAVAPDPDISPILHGVHTLLFIAPDTLLFLPGGHALHVAFDIARLAVE